MESLGEKLRNARESKGYSFDHVGRETNIARRYLEALEAEDFSKFPGEPYILGFLRNYGEYLGLDVQELMSLYRSLRIQEQPVPVEQLLKPQRHFPKPLLIVLIAVVLVGLIAGAVYGILQIPRADPAPVVQNRTPTEYTLETASLERRLYIGDSILIPVGNDQFKMELISLGDSALISSPLGTISLDLSQEKGIDLDGDGLDDISITLSDFIRNDPSKGGLIRFDLAGAGDMDMAGTGEAGAVLAAAGGSAPAVSPEVISGSAASAPAIFTSPSAYPFTLQATFKGYCMFRWESDRREREERYFHKADVQNIQAQNGIRMWVSNASAVRLQVIGGGRTVDLEIGGPGEVVVADLRWVRDDDGRYKLVLVRLD
ncbi:helix-turn-helix domain-containing protein [Breznakiella homolactica]|uniref:Helix-turn-helix domain-containing protein n=1 Tax=Breznakiella homolactica TaxID=2798577 RepID=A0A7T7XNQ8_9SPIR|nr:helix-turn-helix domain-containing protein [Breznakiella homolactica]QQO09715.1 helix-turn-helix domain-containing protein [Breznakiella homolactica]